MDSITTAEPTTKALRRAKVDGEVYVNLEDMLYLVEISRDRHVVHGHQWEAKAMEQFSAVLSAMLFCLD